MDIAQIITAVKDVLLGLAAVTASVVAVLGLRKWRQELEGKAHFEAARNLIRSTYRLRDAISTFRHPFYSGQEFPEGYKGNLVGVADSMAEARAWERLYLNRWALVRTALQEFDTHTLEAEALWGPTIREKTDSLRQCMSELYAAVEAVVHDKASGGQDFQDRDFGKEMRSMVSASPSDKENKLSKRLKSAIDAIEHELRPHLRRS